MAPDELARREFLRRSAAGVGAVGAMAAGMGPALGDVPSLIDAPALPEYRGPNVILVRFGGGVRRFETIHSEGTYAPYFLKDLAPQGTLFTNMVIEQLEGVETSHGQGTLYLLTGKYDKFKDINGKFLGARFEAKVPTLFEYLRKVYNIAEHETLIVNGEDRTDEEFYSFSNHHLFGANYRCTTLSLYRFKVHLLRRQLERGGLREDETKKKTADLKRLESLDYRLDGSKAPLPQIEQFWDDWRAFYGDTGFVNARGDRLLTQIAITAMEKLRPRLMIVNYNDPDYVHWGNPSHYTRGIAVIDQGLRELTTAVEANDFYRGNTVFVIVPDCGRDSNRALAVPFQHHFQSKSAHEIFALFLGPGIARGKVIEREVQQISVASTIGRMTKTPTEFTEGPSLDEVFA
jgi:hypothetical protein